MKCDEAAEFVSALCDGQRIPRETAEHIGACLQCEARLHEYVAMGAELRRVASLEPEQDVKPLTWAEKQGKLSTLWQKGWSMMRIPRFAFAFLVGAIIVLGSSLAMVQVRARSEGGVLLITVTRPDGHSFQCALDSKKMPKDGCAEVYPGGQHPAAYEIRFLARNGNQVKLGVRSVAPPPGTSDVNQDIRHAPQSTYTFQVGERTQIALEGFGSAQVTSEWTDHVPAVLGENPNLDPEPNQLRIISPLLLKGKQVIGDFEGGSVYIKDGEAADIYFPGTGKFLISLSPMKGAVQSKVAFNRISFQWNDQEYVFLTGAPVARSDEQVWVLYEPDYKPGDPEHGFIGGGPLRKIAPEAVITNSASTKN